MLFYSRKALIIAIISGVAVVALITAGIYALATRDRDIRLTVETTPREVELTVNGHSFGLVESGDTVLARGHGTLELTAKFHGFETYHETIDISGDDATANIGLMPLTDEAWALLDEQGELEFQRDVTEKAIREGEEAYANWPILHNLPVEAETFRAYQGDASSDDFDFGIHLYLYRGHEDAGRKAFADWLSDHDYDPVDYNVIEHIDNAAPQAVAPPPPTAEELKALTPDDITIPDMFTTAGMTAGEAAQAFATTTTTWQPKTDTQPVDGLLRARDALSKSLQNRLDVPEKPMLSPKWRDAAQRDARAHSWVATFDTTTNDANSSSYSLTACWAWISNDHAPVLDGPRRYTLTVDSTGDQPVITDIDYEDPDFFVRTNDTTCDVDGLPPATAS